MKLAATVTIPARLRQCQWHSQDFFKDPLFHLANIGVRDREFMVRTMLLSQDRKSIPDLDFDSEPLFP